MNKYSVSPKMPRSGTPAIFMNLEYKQKQKKEMFPLSSAFAYVAIFLVKTSTT